MNRLRWKTELLELEAALSDACNTVLNDSHDRDLVSELSTELANAASANAAKAGDVAALRRHMLRLLTDRAAEHAGGTPSHATRGGTHNPRRLPRKPARQAVSDADSFRPRTSTTAAYPGSYPVRGHRVAELEFAGSHLLAPRPTARAIGCGGWSTRISKP